MRRWFWTGLWSVWGLAVAIVVGAWLWLGHWQQWPDVVGYVSSESALAVSGHQGVLMGMWIGIDLAKTDLPKVRGWVRGLDRMPVGGAAPGWRYSRGWDYWFVSGHRQTCRWGEMWTVTVMPWRVIGALAVVPAAALGVRGRAMLRRRRRVRAGLCAACGYDMRATPDVCPECGSRAGGHGRDAHATVGTSPSLGE